MKITNEQVIAACDIAGQVFDGRLKAAVGGEILAASQGLNKTTAMDFINDYKYLLEGRVFQRAMSAGAMRYFMQQIAKDRGTAGLTNAVTSLRAHIDYYEGHYNVTMHSMRSVADDFAALLAKPQTAQEVARDFALAVARSSRSPRSIRLQRLENSTKRALSVVVQTTVFMRNPDVVAEALFRANGQCERCSAPAPFLRAKDGSPYLEVHHRVQLANGGDDSLENAIALCPNCHRWEHYGARDSEPGSATD